MAYTKGMKKVSPLFLSCVWIPTKPTFTYLAYLLLQRFLRLKNTHHDTESDLIM